LQLQRNLGLGSYRSAWHLAHRIRAAMDEKTLAPTLKGTVEVDETYVGGKPRRSTMKQYYDPKQFRGRGTLKTPVMVLVQRDGGAISHPVERVDAFNLKSAILANVDSQSTIMTDDNYSYRGIGKSFKGGHKVIRHKDKQYVNGDITTNTAESYFCVTQKRRSRHFPSCFKTSLRQILPRVSIPLESPRVKRRHTRRTCHSGSGRKEINL